MQKESKQDRLIRRVLEQSDEQKDFLGACEKEWRISEAVEKEDLSGECICGKKRIRYITFIKRKDNKVLPQFPRGLPIGRECLKHFSPKIRELSHYFSTLEKLSPKDMIIPIQRNIKKYEFLKTHPSLARWIISHWGSKYYSGKRWRLPIDYSRMILGELEEIPRDF